MGLNHQMASLSCALGEAFLTKRTLLLPPEICLFALHTERWSAGSGPGETCVPISELFDMEGLSRLVPVQVANRSSSTARMSRLVLGRGPGVAQVSGSQWPSARILKEYPCDGGVTLVRRGGYISRPFGL